MSEILKDRIRERMEKLGKNPSGLALDAGLGRSAVRDILSGKAKNPGIMTLHRIADQLDCSVNYLTGEQDEVHYQDADNFFMNFSARKDEVSGTLLAGVFKQFAPPPSVEEPPAEWSEDPFKPSPQPERRRRVAIRSKQRYPGRDLYIYMVGDSSLTMLNIIEGDFLIAVSSERMDLSKDRLVICRHTPAGIDADELSARVVKINTDGTVSLESVSSSSKYFAIKLEGRDKVDNTYKTAGNGALEIEGVVVSLSREFPSL